MPCFTPAQRRYQRRVIVVSLIYAAVLIASIYLIKHRMVVGPPAYLVGVLPGIAVSSFFILLARYLVEETDEYQRMLQTRQMLVATGISLTCTTVWGFLEGFGLVGHILAWNWAVIWFVGLGIGGLVNYVIERRAR